jgi:uncharacterized protein
MVEDEVIFYGHPNIQSLHVRAIEVTKNPNLTLRGDCIIGVRANKACKDLDPSLQRRLKKEDSVVRLSIITGNLSYRVNGFGNSRLLLLDAQDIVIRKTNFVCSRTLCVNSDKASLDIPREIVRSLQNPERRAVLSIYIE